MPKPFLNIGFMSTPFVLFVFSPFSFTKAQQLSSIIFFIATVQMLYHVRRRLYLFFCLLRTMHAAGCHAVDYQRIVSALSTASVRYFDLPPFFLKCMDIL